MTLPAKPRAGSEALCSRWSCGLLVSVRDAAEALVAATHGAAIVDVKEPLHGPLGRADAATTAEILVAIGGRAPVTLACGELADGRAMIEGHLMAVLERVPPGTAPPVAVKAGPRNLGVRPWRAAFGQFLEWLPDGIEPVAVAYADWRAASAPTPHDVLMTAADAGAKTVLVDTFDKQGPGLLGVVDVVEVAAWVACAHARGLTLALAGKLTEGEVSRAFGTGADIVGVRSAACDGGRLGRVDPRRVEVLGRIARAPRACGATAWAGELVS